MIFTIWLSGTIPPAYQRCIDSLKSVYPDLAVFTDWGDCPLSRTGNDRDDSDRLRVWLLSEHEEAMYFDADIEAKETLEMPKSGEVVMSHHWGMLDIFAMGHNYAKRLFENAVEIYKNGGDTLKVLRYFECNKGIITLIPNDGRFTHLCLTGRTQNA